MILRGRRVLQFLVVPIGFYFLACGGGSKGGSASLVGNACESDSDCFGLSEGYCPKAQICTRSCTAHSDCGCPANVTTAQVEAGACAAECVYLTSSATSGYCFRVCNSGSQCSANSICTDNICMTPSNTTGSGGSSGSACSECKTAADCTSGLRCIGYRFPANAGFSEYWSMRCASSSGSTKCCRSATTSSGHVEQCVTHTQYSSGDPQTVRGSGGSGGTTRTTGRGGTIGTGGRGSGGARSGGVASGGVGGRGGAGGSVGGSGGVSQGGSSGSGGAGSGGVPGTGGASGSGGSTMIDAGDDTGGPIVDAPIGGDDAMEDAMEIDGANGLDGPTGLD